METAIINGICRCCASEGAFKDIRSAYQWMGAEEIYADMLKECFDLSLWSSGEGDDGGICEVCVTQLRNASNFKKQVLHTEEQFKKHLHTRLFKPSIVKVELPANDGIDSDDNISAEEGYSGTDYEVSAIKVESPEESKPKKRSAKMSTRASTSRAKKAKGDAGESSTKQSTTSKTSEPRRVVQSEGRGIIASIYHFLKQEYEFTKTYMEPNCDISHLRNIAQRTADAARVSTKTVNRILNEEKQLPTPTSKFPSPMQKRKKRGNKIEADHFITNLVRNTIQNYRVVQENPTSAKIKSVLTDKIGFDGCLQTVRNLLSKMGYKWDKKVLTERPSIQMWRFKYLKKMAEYRSERRPIVYTEKRIIYLRTHGANTAPFLLMYAGTKDEFIANASKVYKTDVTYDDPKLSDNDYVKWFNEKLLPHVPPHSVIMVNDSHSVDAEKLPTVSSKKAYMQQWLQLKEIPFDESLCKIKLYDIIKKNKADHAKKDGAIRKAFDVIRLPPNHPELNAIENMWDVVKNDIAALNNEQIVTNPEDVINGCLNRIGNDTWVKIFDHVEKIEKDYLNYFGVDFELKSNMQHNDDSDDMEYSSDSDYIA